MNYTVGELASITHATIKGDPALSIKNIAFDSRHIYTKDHTAFLAINTSKNSGEKYISDVVEKGIHVIISEHELPHLQGITWILVDNAIQFLHRLAKFHLKKFPNIKTIGITGSNGKTIVKEWLYQALGEDYTIVKSPKSFNSQIGLPLSLLQTKKTDEIGIFEVGISEPGEMAKSAEIFSPTIGIFTHLGTAHLINFKNSEALLAEKILLFKTTDSLIFNGDNQLVFNTIYTTYPNKKLISYGYHQRNDLHLISDPLNRSIDISVSYFGEKFSFPATKRDEATLNNALCVIAVLKQFSFSNKKIVDKLNHLKAIEMRLESIEGVKNNLIINDSYILDLDSLKIAYQFIREYQKPKKALIITDFVETKNSEELYAEVAALTNEQNFDKIFLIGEEIIRYQHLFSGEVHPVKDTQQLIDNPILKSLEDYLILLKGARKFKIEKIKTALELQKHDTVLEINLNNILHNINVHKSLLRPETKMMAMVKAFSYGMGSYEVAEFLQHHHIDYFTVAYADEGVDLRKKGITTPIMVMNPELHSYSSIIDYNLEPEIYSFRVLDLFCEQLKMKGFHGKYPIHIKLETGMHRLGFKTVELDELIHKLKTLPIKVQSIFTHLATADVPEERNYALQQIHLFDENSSKILVHLDYKPLRHILNSPGIANFTEYQFDMVRIGIGMIGLSENKEVQKKLKQAVSFKTVISQISTIKPGDTVGYGRHFTATETTRIATIPVGYADGIPRLVGNGKGKVNIGGNLVPIVGNVCMDMMMVNLGNLPAKEGDEVIIFNPKPSLEDFAKYCKTISYEVLTSISRRVKRIYIKD